MPEGFASCEQKPSFSEREVEMHDLFRFMLLQLWPKYVPVVALIAFGYTEHMQKCTLQQMRI